MQKLSKLNGSNEIRDRSVDQTNVVKKGRGKLKNIPYTMRPLRSRNVDVNIKEDQSNTAATREAVNVPPTSIKSNLESKVVPKRTNSVKPTTLKRNSRRMIDESTLGKENRDMEMKTTESRNDEVPMTTTSLTPKLLGPAGRQMILRQNTNVNYRESSPLSQHKVPIYLQKVKDCGTKKHVDPYEPDFVSEDKQNKRKYLSEQHDKTYHEILIQLEKKEEIKRKKVGATSASSSYKKNIQNVMERIRQKVNKKKQKVGSTIDPKTSVQNTSIVQMPVEETESASYHPACPTNSLCGIPDASVQNTSKVQVPVEETRSASYHPACPTNSLCDIPDIQVVHDSSPQLNSSNLPVKINSQTSRLDVCNTSQMQLNKSVSCPQEVTVDSILIDFCNDSQNQVGNPIDCPQVAPEAISLDLYNDSRNEVQPVGNPYITYKSSPYRLMGFRQSPYYMYFKPNALPCLHQNLIIDYDFVTRFGRPPEPKLTRKFVQSSMLTYVEVNGNKENAINSYSLYNIEEFNVSPKKNVGEKERRVLGSVMEPNVLVSTPKKAGSEVAKNIAALDISIIEHEERATKDTNVIEVEIHRTMFETTGPLRQYRKTTLNKPTNDLIEEAGGQLFDDVDPEFLENVDNQVLDVKGKKRRNQFVSNDTTVEDGHRKRKKDEMTKEEKKEFQKWAKEFNQMCAEVEKHQLHIV